MMPRAGWQPLRWSVVLTRISLPAMLGNVRPAIARGFRMPAAVTPRVRNLIVCDGLRASRVEESVFHLRGARFQVRAESFPLRRRLRLFLVLSSPRPGRFPGYVKVIDDQSDRAIFYGTLEPPPQFPDDADLLPLDLPMRVRFPRAGRYTVQVWFFQEASADVLKMEQPFHVVKSEA
jgi:hypothetical protein